jgi:hypothetical protein
VKLIGVDIDGTLLPLRCRADDLEDVRQAVFEAVRAGHRLVLVTSRTDPEEGRERLLDEHGIDLPVFGFSRDDPAGKGRWLLEVASESRRAGLELESVELWDDEDWYLSPAALLGVCTLKVDQGQLRAFTPPPDYVPWINPRTQRPA